MKILAIDPGTFKSGYVVYDPVMNKVCGFGIEDNESMEMLIEDISSSEGWCFAYEMVGHYGTGMSVGKTVFETCIWIGRFERAWGYKANTYRILNREIRIALCGNARAKEKNVHLAAKERFEPYGGGSDPYKGVKAQPGPLFGMKSHEFSALAVALTFNETFMTRTSLEEDYNAAR